MDNGEQKEPAMPNTKPRKSLIRIRILCGEDTALGKGKADLLEAILESGSISAAGRQLGLSYRKAWLMVDEMNRCFASQVVEKAQGGAQGGGAKVTELGKTALERYRVIQQKAQAAIEEDLADFRRLLVESHR